MKYPTRRSSRISLALLTSTLAAGSLLGLSALAQPVTLASFGFNEGTGTTTISPTNSLTGRLGPASNPDATPVFTLESPSGAAGDYAVQLANGAFLVVDDSSTPLLTFSTAFTMEGWVKRDSASTATYEGIMGYGGSYKLGLQNSELIFTLFGIVDISSGLVVPNDEWHHVAAAFEPGVGVTFYLDGVSAFVAETRSPGPFLNNILNLGAERLGTPITGAIDRLRIHRGLLADTDLDTVATTPKAPRADTLVSYAFNEGQLPSANGGTTARPAVSGEEFVRLQLAPRWDTDSPTGGASDRSLNFTTGGMRVEVPDPEAAITLDTGDFTVQAWVKFGTLPGNRSVLFFNNGPGGAVSFSIASRALFVTTLGILDQPSTATIPDDGAWHHVAVVHETGKEFRFYVDGALGATVPYTSGVLIGVRSDTQFYIGSEPNGGLPYVGKLDRLIVSRGIVPAADLDFRAIPGVDPGAPELSIRTVVEISWPTVPAGYRLQSNTDPANAAGWTFVTGTPAAAEGTFRYYAPTSDAKLFYRLIKP